MAFSDLFSRRSIRSALRGALRYVFGKRGQRRVTGWRMFYRMRTELMLQTIAPLPVVQQHARPRLWVDEEVFPRIQRLLARARHTVVIQMFIWKDDRIGRQMAGLLVELADRGVKVFITKEATGDVFEFHRDFLTTKGSHRDVWKRFWEHKLIRVTHASERDHAKVYIIDSSVILLTGMNIANEYHERLHDYMVELHGNGFVEQFLTRGEMPGPQGKTRIVMNSDSRKEIRPEVTRLLESAMHSIVLEQCYISDPKVLDALIAKSKAGVDVTLVVPERTDFQHHHANMESVSRLLAEGDKRRMHVFLYPRMFHAKTILVDREKAFVGSVNLITSSLDDMGEVNVLLEGRDAEPIQTLREALRMSILRSKPVRDPLRFSPFRKLLAYFKL